VPIAPAGHTTLDRVGKLASAVVALVGVSAAMSIVAIWAGQTAQDDARAVLDGTITNEQFVERAAPYLLMSVVQAVATGAAAVVTMIWMFRIARNHRTLHRGGTWGPGWAIGGWFLPPLLFVIPFLMFRELWKASDPETAVGDDWRTNPTSWLIPVWFVFYSLLPLGLLVAQTSNGFTLGTSERDMAQQVIDNQGLTVIGAIVAVAGASAFIMLVRQLTTRHRRLTGEATG
jgi:predicted RecA/RadA family phage recombinase